MSLKPEIYRELMREYDQRQLRNKHEFQAREAALFKKYPRLAEIRQALTENAAKRARASIMKQTSVLSALEDEADDLRNEQAYIFRGNGIREEDLVMHYRCPECKDTGYVNNRPCRCFKQAAIDLLYDKSHLKAALSKENFDTISMEYYSTEKTNGSRSQYQYMQEKIDFIRDYADNFDRNGGNILFCGPTGTGKTFLSNCIAKQLIDSCHFVVYFSAGDFFNALSRCSFGHEDEDAALIESYMTDSDLLIIDDLGTELINSFTTSKLFECLNARHNQNKATIISTNLSPQALADTYTERIASRLLSDFNIITLSGDDIRIKKKFKL